MAKKESTLLNMTLTLFLVALVASTALGLIYKVTKGPIDLAKKQKKEKAIRTVVPDFDNEPSSKAEMFKLAVSDGDSLTFYPAKKGDELVGMAIETFSDKGFTERIEIMVGFLPDGTIYNTSVLKHKETPGLGDKMDIKKSPWCKQFMNKNPADFDLKVSKDGGDVDAITAATISSRAFSDAIDKAYKHFMEYMNNKK